MSKKMSGSFAQKDNVLFEQQSLGRSIRAVVPELPAEVWVSALTLHRALGSLPHLLENPCLPLPHLLPEGRSHCLQICSSPAGGPGTTRLKAQGLAKIIEYGSHILGR